MNLKFRLIILSFLEFFIWGSWLITIGVYWFQNRHWGGADFGTIFSTMGISAIFMPTITGIIADRWINAERLLGLCHLAGAAILFFIPEVNDPKLFYWVLLLYMLFYMPTLSLANTVSYSSLVRAQRNLVKDFPPIRVWGTIGFIAAMWTVSLLHIETSARQFYVAAIASLCLGCYAFTLPKCPPEGKSTQTKSWVETLGLRAFSLFKNSRMALFFIFAMLLGAALQLTNAYGDTFLHDFAKVDAYKDTIAVKYPAIIMSISQISETLFILAIPFFLRRFGIKQVMLISMFAWVLRFGLFAFGNPADGLWMIILSCIVYGMAFDFFNISGSLFVDTQVKPEIRASAQGIFMMMTNGFGAWLGSKLSGLAIATFFTNANNELQWHDIWIAFASYSLIVAVLFALFFVTNMFRAIYKTYIIDASMIWPASMQPCADPCQLSYIHNSLNCYKLQVHFMRLPSIIPYSIVSILLLISFGCASQHKKDKAVQFKKHILTSEFIAEGVATGDVNKDGKLDIIAGAYWFEAPDWKKHELKQPVKFNADSSYSDSFLDFASDVNQDGWVDLVRIGWPGDPAAWYENNKNQPGYWKEHALYHAVGNESPTLVDVDGDGRPDLLCNDPEEKKMIWLQSPVIPGDTTWKRYVISNDSLLATHKYTHGLGVGDMNGDGRKDVIIKSGWWESPADPKQPDWIFHKADLGQDCSEMYLYDVDGDGDLDVISSSAHDYGIWWHEKVMAKDGSVSWKEHLISKAFSESHGLALEDVNGDGYPDLITGKRYYAHNGGDPGGHEAAVLYWFESKPGKEPQWIPHPIDDNSGVGLHLVVRDMNSDGLPDIVIGNKKGVFYFEQEK